MRFSNIAILTMVMRKFSFRNVICLTILSMTCLKTQGQSSVPDESFESLKEKLMMYSNVKYPGQGYIDGNYSREIFSVPFQKCMESANPLQKEHLIYKMFYDAQLNVVALEMIQKYIQKTGNSSDKSQMLFNFLLKNMAVKNRPFINRAAGPFSQAYQNDLESKLQPVPVQYILTSFSDKYYDKESKQIIKDLLLKDGCSGRWLFLIDVAGIYDDPEMNKFLKDKAAKCEEWQWRNNTEWVALLILARHGDKEAIKKVVEVTKKPVQNRQMQVWCLPLQLAYVPQPEIIDLLKEFLASKESYWNGGDCIPQSASLSHSSAIALSNMIKGYPKVNEWKYTDEQRKGCSEWFNIHKEYELNINNKWSRSIQNALFR